MWVVYEIWGGGVAKFPNVDEKLGKSSVFRQLINL